MTTETLFEMPKMPPKPIRRRGPRSQQERCKRCVYTAFDDTGAYCRKHDLCIDFENGRATTARDGLAIYCIGGTWEYATAANTKERTKT